jgi:hypothetical protein
MRGRRARSHQGDAPRRPYMHHRIHPHPALRAGLPLPGRGVSFLLRRKQVGVSTIALRRTASPLHAVRTAACVGQRPSQHAGVHVVGAVCERGDGQPRALHHGQGTAAPRPDATRERAWFIRSCAAAAGNVGATRWVAWRGPCAAGTRDDAGPSCTIAPGRRTASPLHCPGVAACVAPRNSGAPGVHVVGAVREPPLQRLAVSVMQTW